MHKFGRRNSKQPEEGLLPGIALAILITVLAVAWSYDNRAADPYTVTTPANPAISP